MLEILLMVDFFTQYILFSDATFFEILEHA